MLAVRLEEETLMSSFSMKTSPFHHQSQIVERHTKAAKVISCNVLREVMTHSALQLQLPAVLIDGAVLVHVIATTSTNIPRIQGFCLCTKCSDVPVYC